MYYQVTLTTRPNLLSGPATKYLLISLNGRFVSKIIMNSRDIVINNFIEKVLSDIEVMKFNSEIEEKSNEIEEKSNEIVIGSDEWFYYIKIWFQQVESFYPGRFDTKISDDLNLDQIKEKEKQIKETFMDWEVRYGFNYENIRKLADLFPEDLFLSSDKVPDNETMMEDKLRDILPETYAKIFSQGTEKFLIDNDIFPDFKYNLDKFINLQIKYMVLMITDERIPKDQIDTLKNIVYFLSEFYKV